MMEKPASTVGIQRILVPTDFSPTSQRALDYATRLAESTGAAMILMHALELPDTWSVSENPTESDPELMEKLRAIQPTSDKVVVERVVHGGPPGPVICWVAQERQCDLIVMGTHGRKGLSHLLLGSVAEEVIRNAPCPVLTVRDRPANERPLREPEIYVPMPPVV